MSGKIEISRELAERLCPIAFAPNDPNVWRAREDLRALLAAPVVERQEPPAFGFWRVPKGFPLQGMFVRWTEESADHIASESAREVFDFQMLYTSPPAPAADDMVRLLTRARIYARGEFRDEIDACLGLNK